MSNTEDTTAGKDDNDVSVCANCGKGEEESDKLKACTACKMVKYCNRECQIAHRPQHKKECKRRAAEMHDEKLFEQPQYEDCPICFLRLPEFQSGSRYQSCCGKVICSGCAHASVYDDQGNEVDNEKCAFCRVQDPTSEEIMKRIKKRVKLNDPIAINNLGNYYRDGRNGHRQDHKKAFELYHRAGELGHATAYCSIGYAYQHGEGVEVDKKKAVYYYELAAMGEDAIARYNLGLIEKRAGNYDRALKHFMIAVRDGHSRSLKMIKEFYSRGYTTKDAYMKALQAYQVYLGEIKSEQRDKAAAFDEEYRYYESGV